MTKTDNAFDVAVMGDAWLAVTLPDGRIGMRETNTMPQWAGSCWYYLRYLDPRNDKSFCDPAKERYGILEQAIRGLETTRQRLLIMHRSHELSVAEISRRKIISSASAGSPASLKA